MREPTRILSFDFARAILSGSLGSFACSILAAALVIAGFFALSYAATLLDRQSAVEKLERANAQGVFGETLRSPFGRVFPRFGGNDCLILATLLQDYSTRLAEAISIRIPSPATAPQARAGDVTNPACLQLIDILDRPRHSDPAAVFYHRYLHGQRLFALLGLAAMPPQALGVATLLLNLLALLSVLIPALLRARTGGSRERGYAAIAAALLACDGLWVFGLYFSFGISDLVLALFLACAYHLRLAQGAERRFIVASAHLGAATALFEFLTGGIPFGLALLIGVVAIDGSDATALARRAFHGSVAFVLAILVAFAAKIALVALLVDPGVMADFGQALALRVSTDFASQLPPQEAAWVAGYGVDLAQVQRHWPLTVLYMLARLGYASFVIGYGSPLLGMAIVGIAFALTLALLVRHARRASDMTARMRIALLAGSALVMPAWSLVFLNHTLLHAIWMVRPFGWYAALAGVLLSCPRVIPDSPQG